MFSVSSSAALMHGRRRRVRSCFSFLAVTVFLKSSFVLSQQYRRELCLYLQMYREQLEILNSNSVSSWAENRIRRWGGFYWIEAWLTFPLRRRSRFVALGLDFQHDKCIRIEFVGIVSPLFRAVDKNRLRIPHTPATVMKKTFRCESL